MSLVSDFSNAVRESANRVFSALSRSRSHHGLPVQGSLFPEDPRPLVRLSATDAEALACLAMVKELEEEQWSRVLMQYGEETKRGGIPRDAVEVETVFYLSLWKTAPAAVWIPVVQRFELLKADPFPSLELMGR